MKPESRLHKHPKPGRDGKHLYMHGQLLEIGDELRAGDVVANEDGRWIAVVEDDLLEDDLLFDLEPFDFRNGRIWVRPS